MKATDPLLGIKEKMGFVFNLNVGKQVGTLKIIIKAESPLDSHPKESPLLEREGKRCWHIGFP